MFEIGWTEMLVIAIVMIVIVGPKDLPKMLRTFGRFTSKMTSMAGDFRKQFDEALKEAELDDVKTTLDSARKLNPAGEIRKALNPIQQAADDVRKGLDLMAQPKPEVPSATAPAAVAEPVKTGATALAGEAAPSVTPPAPVIKPKPAAKATAKAATSAASAAKTPASKPAARKTAAAQTAAKATAKRTTAKKPAGAKS